MAILIYFQKAQENQATVEYTFGYPSMDRSLVIRKDNQDAQPSDGNTDGTFAAVAFKILTIHRKNHAWPEAGSYAA